MQVNQTTDHVTHAVIGPAKTRDFKLQGDSNLFNILSSALYSDKEMAVVREVLCNAWDIHIHTGITNRAVEVTINKDSMTIRDFGTGIHDDKMVDIYGTFGASTKAHDGFQTGGFGLGSKSPFAVGDHFEVTSWHAGMKTIYSISKSSAEVAGCPGITPLVSVPTDETGLAVTVTFKDRKDQELYTNLVGYIAKYGEMNVILNGATLPVLPFSEAPHAFMLLDTQSLPNRINIRYGNVLYPMPPHEAYSKQIYAVTELIDRVMKENRSYDYYNSRASRFPRLILMAQPHSISVTPSRETLSLTDHTITTITKLLNDFLALSDTTLVTAAEKKIHDHINEKWRDFKPGLLLEASPRFSFRSATTTDIKNIATIDQMAESYVSAAYPGEMKGYQEKDIISRLDSLIAGNFGNRGKIQSFKAAYTAVANLCKSDQISSWLQRTIINPITTRLVGNKLLNIGQLYLYKSYDKVIPVSKCPQEPILNYIPLLRNIMILAHNRGDIAGRVSSFPEMKFYGPTESNLAYIVPRSPARIEAAREFFKAQGFTIIDLTMWHEWENKPEPVAKKAKDTPVIKRPKGIPLMTKALTSDGYLTSPDYIQNPDFPRTETPEVFIRVAKEWDTACLCMFQPRAIVALARLFGPRIGVVRTLNQVEKYQLPTMPMFKKWIVEQMIVLLQTNPEITRALGRHKAKHETRVGYEATCMVRILEKDPALAKAFKLGSPFSKDVDAFLDLFDAVDSRSNHFDTASYSSLLALYRAIPADPTAKELYEKLNKIKMMKIFSISNLESIFDSSSSTVEDIAAARKIILLATKA